MTQNAITGLWTLDANNYTGKLQLWLHTNALNGRIWFDTSRQWEPLSNIHYDAAANQLQFTRPNPPQQYTAAVAFDALSGSFTDQGQNYPWQALRARPSLSMVTSGKPEVNFLAMSPSSPDAPRILILLEKRLLAAFLASFSGGSSVLQRYLDDLQNEGWEAYAYSYDVRSDETGEQQHRHLPSEVLTLYRYIRRFYQAAEGKLDGVVMIGDFPAAGTCSLEDRPVPGGSVVEQHEMDFFGVDAMLADPHGYWEWLAVAPMVPPGSTETYRLPFDEGRHPNGSLYERNQWSAPGFVHSNQSEVHHSLRSNQRYGAHPQYWIGRITAAQVAWQTGVQGLEYSPEEEMRLLVSYFNRNHAHRTGSRVARGYLFITDLNLASPQGEQSKMEAAIPAPNINTHVNDPVVPQSQQSSIANYISSFQQEYLVGEYIMHSDWLNHYFPGGQDIFPATFPSTYASPGSSFSIPLLPANAIKATHILAIPGKNTSPRFYVLGGCDAGAILHRPRFLVDGEHIAATTPLHRQYAANMLAIAYLIHGNGLAVLAHNVTNPVGDYSSVYQSWHEGRSFGEGVLKLMRDENAQRLPFYRNVVFGDPTLRLLY